MQVANKITPAITRGEDRRVLKRMEQADWRVNQRSYNFLGMVFDPLTPLQTLARIKWMTVDHRFRYLMSVNVQTVLRLSRSKGVKKPVHEASWLSICGSSLLEYMAAASGIPIKFVPQKNLVQQLFDNIIAKEDGINIIGSDASVVDVIKNKYDISKINYHEFTLSSLGCDEHKTASAVEAATSFIAKNPARYSFICVGTPHQEIIAKHCAEREDCVGLGLCFDEGLIALGGETINPINVWRMNMFKGRLFSVVIRTIRCNVIDTLKVITLWVIWGFSRN